MSVDRRSARRQGIIAGIVTFVLSILPTVGLMLSAASGTVGSVEKNGLGALALIVFGAISVGSGYLVFVAFDREPGRRPGDVWSTWFGGLVFLVVGTWFAPFIIVLIFVDSDTSLKDQPLLVFALWTAIHLIAAGIALAFAHELLHHSGHTAEAEAAPESVAG